MDRLKYLDLLKRSNETCYNCMICDNEIYYPHTNAKINNGVFSSIAATHKTTKKIGDSEYHLSVCYFCLLDKFPEILEKSSSKLFNTCNNYVKFAFNVSDQDFNIQKKRHAVTIPNLEKKYGKAEAIAKWESYVDKQRVTNLFEYKSKKYGMSEEEFKEFNQSRSCTLENFIKRHGEETGREKWNSYINRQAYTNTLEYLISKYGNERGETEYRKINSKKAHTYENYVSRLGLEIGSEEFDKYINKIRPSYSKCSQDFFQELDKRLAKFNFTTYFHRKNGEFGKVLKEINRYCKVDYYIKELNIAVEYYGDYWHANPSKYSGTDVLHSGHTAFEIWEHDTIRNSILEKEHKIKTIIVWQNADSLDREKELNKIVNEITASI